ncbi:MAG: response regulator [Clostridia bacterium]|nr:response regulator [Clostridia bacterium]
MAEEKKRLLIADDSFIDREILHHILENHFEITDAKNGYEALDILTKKEVKFDAMLLDVVMPLIDGFSVLQLMKNNGITGIPIIMMTAEATKENVRRAAEFGITSFVSKPFDGEMVLEKVHTLLDIEPRNTNVYSVPLKEFDINDTNIFIGRLTGVYKDYLKNKGVSDEKFKRVSELTRILMTEYGSQFVGDEYEPAKINMITTAAYFYNIGYMTIPDRCIDFPKKNESDYRMFQKHTTAGAKFVRLNTAPSCAYFTAVCTDICMYHHERADGTGFPHQLTAEETPIHAQVCAFAMQFDEIFCKLDDFTRQNFNIAISQLAVDTGAFSEEIYKLARECKGTITDFYINRFAQG